MPESLVGVLTMGGPKHTTVRFLDPRSAVRLTMTSTVVQLLDLLSSMETLTLTCNWQPNMINTVAKCRNIRDLRLVSIALHEAGGRVLSRHKVWWGPALQSVDLSNNGLGAIGTSLIAGVLGRSLTNLNLEGNNMSPVGILRLQSKCPNLKMLNLAYNDIGATGAAYLVSALRDWPALESLNLRYNNLDTEGAACLALAAGVNPLLKELDLSSNSLGPEAMVSVCQLVSKSPKLTRLELVCNVMTPGGATSLAAVLPNLLQHLNVGYNFIYAEGCTSLARGLSRCSGLRTLHLGFNNIRDDGVHNLVRELRHCPLLEGLNLGDNLLTELAAEPLVVLLQSCRSLTSLNLNRNNLRDGGACSLADVLPQSTLQTITMCRNHITIVGLRALVAARVNTDLDMVLRENDATYVEILSLGTPNQCLF